MHSQRTYRATVGSDSTICRRWAQETSFGGRGWRGCVMLIGVWPWDLDPLSRRIASTGKRPLACAKRNTPISQMPFARGASKKSTNTSLMAVSESGLNAQADARRESWFCRHETNVITVNGCWPDCRCEPRTRIDAWHETEHMMSPPACRRSAPASPPYPGTQEQVMRNGTYQDQNVCGYRICWMQTRRLYRDRQRVLGLSFRRRER